LQLQAQQAAARINATKNAKRRGPPAVGFGLELNTDRNEKVYVSDVARNGNAANAGIKKGDYVIAVGGVELGSIHEFEEIVKVLNNGDQLELKISRRGRESDVMMTFGEAQEVPEGPVQQETVDSLQFERPTDSRQTDRQISQPENDQRFEFVPQENRQTRLGTPVVNPRAFDIPTPPSSEIPESTTAPGDGVERPELPVLELELPDAPVEDAGSVLEND
jgi:hypothetical protein